MTTLKMTSPAHANSLDATSIMIMPSATTRLSPKRTAIAPPGMAMNTPGARYSPTSRPISARLAEQAIA
ncbi:hypothetical protein [Roseibium sp. SCP14]|uniref:hypothetical protein n=1 Tax=Roseibium sp. SCP14 TaxID=3141375 RepID=UPI003334FE88